MTSYSKLDHWALKAQKEGYPARSVYKLKEMDEKFALLKKSRSAKSASSGPFRVLDLGAAPGSWSLYLLRKFLNKPGGSQGAKQYNPAPFALVAVDLAPLSRACDQGLFDKPEFIFIQGDFTDSENRGKILSLGPYNLLISDAAPATSGNRSLDTIRSLELAGTALDYARTCLSSGGNLVIKVFQGGDTGDLLKNIRGLFKTGRSFKPQSCRAESFETYFLGLGKK